MKKTDYLNRDVALEKYTGQKLFPDSLILVTAGGRYTARNIVVKYLSVEDEVEKGNLAIHYFCTPREEVDPLILKH